MITLTQAQAIDILNRLDRADRHGHLLKVTGGIHTLNSTKLLMDQLKPADKGALEVVLSDLAYYNLVIHRLHKWECTKFGIYKGEGDE